jgi:hypothetical protein
MGESRQRWLLAVALLAMAAPARSAPRTPAGAHTHPVALPATAALARDTLAWVGTRAVTAEDLVRRVELMPWPNPEDRGADTANVRALEALVAEKLLAQEAERQGPSAAGRIGAMRGALARALTRDALYRREVNGDTTRAAAVLDRALRGRRVTVDPATFQLLCDSLRAAMAVAPSQRMGHQGRIRILSDDVDALLVSLSGRLGRTLATLPTGKLTLEDALEDLRFFDFTVRSLAPAAFARDLDAHLKVVVERDLIAAEGAREGLDRLPDVQHELVTWTDAWRASALVGRVLGDARASAHATADPLRWLALHLPDRARDLCEVDVEEILAPTEDEAKAARAELRSRGASAFAEVARSHGTRKQWAARDGRSGYFAVRANQRIGYAALLAPTDSLVGPLAMDGGFSVFRALGKRVRADSSATPGTRALVDGARRAAIAEIGARRVDDYVAGLAARTRVRIEPARAQAVALSTRPMLTRRALGFGGAMMAAPGMLPEWGWARVWRAAGPALP